MGKKDAKSGEKEKAEGVKKADCGGKDSKDNGPITVVLKLEMHCEGCAERVRRSIKGFKGVEALATDVGGNILTVIGKVDPAGLRDHVESKTHRKVDLVSPAVSVKKEKESSKDGRNGDAQKPKNLKDQKMAADKKPKAPSVTTVVLKVRLHCEGCILRIRKHIFKIKGVDSVSMDKEKDLVTVKGTMDTESLPELLTAKLKRGVEVVHPKDGEGYKEKGEMKTGNSGAGVGGGEKEKGVEAAKDPAATATATATATVTATSPAVGEASRMEYYGGGYGSHPYRIEMVHAPQLFSDENPNACSVM